MYWLVYYLVRTQLKDYYINLKCDIGLEHIDTNFSSNRSPTMPKTDYNIVRSRYSYIITYIEVQVI